MEPEVLWVGCECRAVFGECESVESGRVGEEPVRGASSLEGVEWLRSLSPLKRVVVGECESGESQSCWELARVETVELRA